MTVANTVPAAARALFIAVALAALSVPVEVGAQSEHGVATHQLTLDHGKKWATEQALGHHVRQRGNAGQAGHSPATGAQKIARALSMPTAPTSTIEGGKGSLSCPFAGSQSPAYRHAPGITTSRKSSLRQ